MSNITIIDSMAALNRVSSPRSVSIIDFHAVWCGPCKAIAPVFAKLATTYAGRVQFLKVDVDQAKDVAAHFSVSAMPTFTVLKGKNKVDEMKGANPAGLEALVRKHAPAAGSSAGPAEKGLEGFSSLNGSIDAQQVQCLNEDASHTVRDLLKGGGDKWLESDADEQLLLHIPTQQSIKIRAIRFTTVPSKISQAPKSVRLFVNASSTLGFDDAESLEAAQEFELTEKQAKGEEAVQLRFVRFQNVTALSIFVASNQGDEDTTVLSKLELLGQENAGTDMSALKKGEDDHDH
ncbi:thioredoxin-like protein 1-like protein [Leucosporidium creatinivorum]|uniref:Thioredoxin-like protein 1-like protein n=1 Tax=Leucosporidium creatinivorum TaxID=106004 RepID=A0A1Y2ERX2_9BASI|nr:thioredoxin-like protein 1-like protein [Leucosporidium creatinivorum]